MQPALEQYERMMRWHVKLSSFRTGVPMPTIPVSKETGEAFLEALNSATREPDGTLTVNMPPALDREMISAFRAAFQMDELADVARAFFVECFHLKDWIKKDASIVGFAVEPFVNKSAHLEAARDICNGAKHLVLTSQHATPVLTPESFEMDVNDPQVVEAAMTVEVRGQKHDVFALADQCVAEWRTVLESLGVL